MLILTIQTGLRVSELVGLDCGDVALGTGGHVRVEGKGRKAGLLALLVGGSSETLERVRPLLDAVAGSVLHVGDAGDAAALKLAVNGLLATQLAVAGELLDMLRDGGVDLHAAASVLGTLPVASPVLSAALPRVLGGALAPNFPLDLVDKDLGYLLAQMAEAPVLEAVRRRVRAGDPGRDVLSLSVPQEPI